MISILLQLVVVVMVFFTAGLKSLRFAPSEITDFELERRIKSGDQDARREADFRSMHLLLDALRRLVVLLLTILIVITLGGAYNFIVAVVWAFVWLLIVELLSSKQFTHRYAEQLARNYEPQIIRAAHALRPVLQFITDSQVLGSEKTSSFYSKQELLEDIQRDTTVLGKDEKVLIRQALAYHDMSVKDIMTPRSVVVTVEATDTVGPLLLDKLHKAGHSRYPVTGGDLDHVEGILYMRDLIPLDPKSKQVQDVMSRKVFYVHQDKALDHVLQAFLRTKHHLFMVVNEFEEVMGVITIEDVLEAIIGRKIVDEFDQYEDLRAVAKLVADERRKVRQS